MRHLFALTLGLLGCFVSVSRADVFILSNQGQVQGELLNKDESPRVKYVIRTVNGGQLTLAKEQVVEVRRETAAQAEYEKAKAGFADTADGQWQLSEWCREKGLSPQRDAHLKRVIELDPDHELARRALGFGKVNGRWTNQDEVMIERGYVRYKGEWRLPQEVELMENRRKVELAEKEWKANLKRWRDWLNTNDRWEKALDLIGKINDPAAVPALEYQLENEKNQKIRKLWIEALGRLATPAALNVLVTTSLEDNDLEIRLSALDEIVKHKNPEIVDRYIKGLKSKENVAINRAAACLAKMEDPSAIGPLVDVLVTTHKHTFPQGSDQIKTSFSPNGGGGGLSMGSRMVTVTRQLANESVRDALIQLSGVNFGYDVERWKTWLAARKKSESVNVRRDVDVKN